MENTFYKKVEIKSEQDLPKEDRRYYFHLKGNFDLTSCLIPSAKYNQIKKRIDWYFQPVEPQEAKRDNTSQVEKQTAEELGDKLCEYCPLEKKGVYSVPGGFRAGCEGSHCNEAFKNYAQNQQPEIIVTDEIWHAIKFIADNPYQDAFVCENCRQFLDHSGDANDNSIEIAHEWSKQYDIVIKAIRNEYLKSKQP